MGRCWGRSADHGQAFIDVRLLKKAKRRISAGNLDLSARTESQASSLAQTAASMQEINADHCTPCRLPTSNQRMPNLKDRPSRPDRVAGILGTATVLALLYFGRDILIPITLAIILSLLITPVINRLRKLGLGQTISVAVAVLALAIALVAVGAVIGSQVIRIGVSLPQYASTIRGKLTVLDALTLGKMGELDGQAGQWMAQIENRHDDGAAHIRTNTSASAPSTDTRTPIPVEIYEQPRKPLQLLTRVVSSIWSPLETTGIVLVVLIFVLLEHEALRDRFIRLVGGNDLYGTTVAVNDAGARLSRFFVSQFAVNLAVGLLIWLGLSVLGLSQALLWGSMAAIFRFIPYIGVWITAFCATLLAAAISPGWSLAIMTLAMFFAIELIVSQLIEPKLYGHTTGLSPLSVVVAAIFWSWIWGPVGLILSTPLTLCLVVAGRYFRAFNIFEILLGEIRALTLPQNFYQRALSGDTHEIISSARQILKRKTLAAYCDSVLLPALHLAKADLDSNVISRSEQIKVGGAIAAVIEALGERRKWWQHYKPVSLLQDLELGRHLRHRREAAMGNSQGSFDVPEGSIILAIGVGSPGDELAAEILVRILRNQDIDGRHITLHELLNAPPDARTEIVATYCVVSIEPITEQDQVKAILADLQARFPQVRQLALLISNPFEQSQQQDNEIEQRYNVVRTYEDAVQKCLEALRNPDKSQAS
jgi:predicted PurR-regulated permease PerM